MNKIFLHGNVGGDPEIRKVGTDKKVAKFSLATNKSYLKNGEKHTETSWHNIIFWNKLADLCEKYVKKGNSIIVIGEISYRSYENKDGQTVYITEIIGNELHFTSKKEELKSVEESKPPYKSGFSDINELPGHVEEQQEASANDDDLPF